MHGGQWMVVLIVLIAVAGTIIKNRYRYHARTAADRPVESADTMRLREEVRVLKDRVQVLERVITDNHGRIDLDKQIEQLRDR